QPRRERRRQLLGGRRIIEKKRTPNRETRQPRSIRLWSMTSLIESQRRRLLRHGFIFLFVAVWLGIAIAVLPHPRAWLTAHLTAFLTCLILVAIGLVWRELKLTERQRSVAVITGLTSAYLGLTGNIFNAIVD